MKNQIKDKFIFAALITFFSLMIIFGFWADNFDNPSGSRLPFLTNGGFLATLFTSFLPNTAIQPASSGFNNADSTGINAPLLEQNTPAIAPAPANNFQLKTLANKATAPTTPSEETVPGKLPKIGKLEKEIKPEPPPVSKENIPQNTALELSPILSKLLKIRKLEKEIMMDKEASTRCYVKPFIINLSGVASAQAEIIFEITKGTSAEIEVGSLPFDIDLVFSQNNDYFIIPQSGQNRLGLTINRGEQAQRGSFSIPIIFTQKGARDSLTICQINIINL